MDETFITWVLGRAALPSELYDWPYPLCGVRKDSPSAVKLRSGCRDAARGTSSHAATPARRFPTDAKPTIEPQTRPGVSYRVARRIGRPMQGRSDRARHDSRRPARPTRSTITNPSTCATTTAEDLTRLHHAGRSAGSEPISDYLESTRATVVPQGVAGCSRNRKCLVVAEKAAGAEGSIAEGLAGEAPFP